MVRADDGTVHLERRDANNTEGLQGQVRAGVSKCTCRRPVLGAAYSVGCRAPVQVAAAAPPPSRSVQGSTVVYTSLNEIAYPVA